MAGMHTQLHFGKNNRSLAWIGGACLSETVGSLIKLLQNGFCFFSNCVRKKLYNWIYLLHFDVNFESTHEADSVISMVTANQKVAKREKEDMCNG